ncbi:hypothetical protein BJ508DRAFT_415652 [Ascobolus immersus RN42]|uniref:4a-hydroxytetrahydrobiopterin dehydratase n=1 Tax=Ascobolus immersus RN42 TaxID=1160509 RepID=A0A3N4IDN1_ASCIM|nr:hypothetical protein BJ508DRAFT_415652 [Ascobolus immersus RN42]
MLHATQQHDHHPTLIWAGDLVSVEWTTHTPPGLGPKDVKMAYLTDELVRGVEQLGFRARKDALELRFWPEFERPPPPSSNEKKKD